VSDSRGAIHDPAGLDPDAVLEHKRLTGSVLDFPGARNISQAELLALSCDILIPAALENQIRADNVARIDTRLIVEAANGPTTPAADEALAARGIPVLPDILANAGGVAVSYFEWVQNVENEQWEEEHVNAKLERKMRKATDAVLDLAMEVNGSLDALADEHAKRGRKVAALGPIDLRCAAVILAIRRVSRVTLARGIWP